MAVVVAWVFFRADSFTTAGVMLSGMAGLNGVSLPASLSGSLSPLAEAIPQLNLVFNGFASATKIPAMEWFAKLSMGLAIVWLLPNLRQMLAKYKPTWNDMAGVVIPSTQSAKRPGEWLTWQPVRKHAIALGILFIWCVDSLSKVSEFLYFRF